MAVEPILTIAVPIYNMERWLDKNLATYCDPALIGRLEVLCLNNASTDGSRKIIKWFAQEYPEIFVLIQRESRGYGGSINEAMRRAQGTYFRIVDADDWVDTQELIKEINALENSHFDIVLTDYQIVNMKNGEISPVHAKEFNVKYGVEYQDFSAPRRTLPSIHGTTYRTGLLRESGFQMQDNIFFVDEEYVVLPYLAAKSVIYFPFDIYRYQIANPQQSTAPKNRGKFQEHRERVLKRLIAEYQTVGSIVESLTPGAMDYCTERIGRGVGDHFTTLYIYVENRQEGRRLAEAWKAYLQRVAPQFWQMAKKKALVLKLLNFLGISSDRYVMLKKLLLRERLQ